MSVANPGEFRFGYLYGGGSPPASLEVFVVGKDGTAQYIAGHPWPKQPPFDEIGIYRRKLKAAEWNDLQQAIEAAHRERARIGASPLPPDAGVESLFALQDEGLWRASWNPHETPSVLADLLARTRALIADLHAHPACTLRAAFEFTPADSQLRLCLANRGKLPFEFSGFGATPEQGGEIRVSFAAEEDLQLSRTRSPIQMLRQPPVGVEQLGGVAGGEAVVAPGQALVLTVKNPGLISRLGQPGQSGVLYALIHVHWKVPGFEAIGQLEEGWLMPQPLQVV